MTMTNDEAQLIRQIENARDRLKGEANDVARRLHSARLSLTDLLDQDKTNQYPSGTEAGDAVAAEQSEGESLIATVMASSLTSITQEELDNQRP